MDDQDLVALERRTYLAAYDNGMWDILLGLWFLVIGVGVVLDAGSLPAILLVPVLIGPWQHLHKRISESRVGYVRLSPTRARRLRRGPLVLAALAGLLVILLIWRAEIGGAIDAGVRGEIGVFVLLGALIAVAAYVSEFRRLYAYVGVVAIGAAADTAFPSHTPWMMVGVGAVICATGAWVLATYLRRYPAAPAEEDA